MLDSIRHALFYYDNNILIIITIIVVVIYLYIRKRAILKYQFRPSPREEAMTSNTQNIDQLAINTIRALAADTVRKANRYGSFLCKQKE